MELAVVVDEIFAWEASAAEGGDVCNLVYVEREGSGNYSGQT